MASGSGSGPVYNYWVLWRWKSEPPDTFLKMDMVKASTVLRAIAKLCKCLSQEYADVATELVVVEARRAGCGAPVMASAGIERLVEQLERAYTEFLQTARREYSKMDEAGGVVQGNPRAMEALAYYFSGHMARRAACTIRSALDGSATGHDVVDQQLGRSDA